MRYLSKKLRHLRKKLRLKIKTKESAGIKTSILLPEFYKTVAILLVSFLSIRKVYYIARMLFFDVELSVAII